MRLDAVPPRTRAWLAVLAVALLLCGLAMAGLGGRITPLADDPALVQRLPQLAAPAAERLGPPGQYAEVVSRPLFNDDRRPRPFVLVGDDGSAARAFDFKLTSVLVTPQVSLAILQPSAGGPSVRVKVGDPVDGATAYRLVSVDARSAVFEGPDGAQSMDLRVYDGQGGEPPTALQAGGGNAPGVVRAPVPAMPGPPPPPVAMGTPRAATPAPPATAPPLPASAQGAAPPVPSSQAMDDIRRRIEARRQQLRQQQGAAPTPNR